MRPPQITGGNRHENVPGHRVGPGFNEAPADHGGEPCRPRHTSGTGPRFNEAPADHGGELAVDTPYVHGFVPASMRPPQITGGNL